MKNRNLTYIGLLLIGLFLALCLTGCAKVVRTETKRVQATISEVRYRPGYTTPMICGKVTTFIHHPASYEVTIEYDGHSLTLNDSVFYNECKDKIGRTIECEYITKYYDDHTSKSYLNWSGSY